MMQLAIGRIIHLQSPNTPEICTAAIVTRVRDASVDVTAFPATGPVGEAARRVVFPTDYPYWHDPRECPTCEICGKPHERGTEHP